MIHGPVTDLLLLAGAIITALCFMWLLDRALTRWWPL